MKPHPCKTCLTKACCRRNCDDYKKYDTAFENFLYGIGLLISLFVHVIVVYLLIAFAEYPKTGMLIYFGAFYLVMIGMIIKNEEGLEHDTKTEFILVWTMLPLWLLTMVTIYIAEKTKWDEYPKKHNPYYKKLAITLKESERKRVYETEKEIKRNQNASA